MIGLVSCCGPKMPNAAPARVLYTSPLFRLSVRWAEKHCDRWFVLSALYGLVGPDRVIEPYDWRLGRGKGAARWGQLVIEQMRGAGLLGETFVALAGQSYVNPLLGKISLDEPLAGMQIGERLACTLCEPVAAELKGTVTEPSVDRCALSATGSTTRRPAGSSPAGRRRFTNANVTSGARPGRRSPRKGA